MISVLLVIHVLVSILLVVSILLQSSKGGGMAGMFGGGGGGGGVFGGRGAATFLSKVTLWMSVSFAVTSLSIALLSKGASRQQSMIQQVLEQEQGTSTPAAMLPTVPGSQQESQPPVQPAEEVPLQEE